MQGCTSYQPGLTYTYIYIHVHKLRQPSEQLATMRISLYFGSLLACQKILYFFSFWVPPALEVVLTAAA